MLQGAEIRLFSVLSNPYFTLEPEQSFKDIHPTVCHSIA